MTNKEEQIEDLLTDAQDALFENNLQTVIEKCKEVLNLKSNELEAFQVMHIAYVQLCEYSNAMENAINWGKKLKKGETSFIQIRSLLETSFLISEKEVVLEAASSLLENVIAEEGSPTLLYLLVFTSALISDLGDTELANQLLDACQGIEMAQRDEQQINIFAAYTDFKTGNTTGGHKGIAEIKEKFNNKTEETNLGASLEFEVASAVIALHFLETEDLDQCTKLIQECESEIGQNIPIPNLTAVKYLMDKHLEKEVENEKQILTKATENTNIIIKRRILALVSKN